MCLSLIYVQLEMATFDQGAFEERLKVSQRIKWHKRHRKFSRAIVFRFRVPTIRVEKILGAVLAT